MVKMARNKWLLIDCKEIFKFSFIKRVFRCILLVRSQLFKVTSIPGKQQIS